LQARILVFTAQPCGYFQRTVLNDVDVGLGLALAVDKVVDFLSLDLHPASCFLLVGDGHRPHQLQLF